MSPMSWEEPPFWEKRRGGGPVTEWMESRTKERKTRHWRGPYTREHIEFWKAEVSRLLEQKADRDCGRWWSAHDQHRLEGLMSAIEQWDQPYWYLREEYPTEQALRDNYNAHHPADCYSAPGFSEGCRRVNPQHPMYDHRHEYVG